MKSKTLKTFTIIIAVLGVIGGMILGSIVPEVEISWSGRTQEHFNVALMLEAWVGTILYVIPCFALSNVLENQEAIFDKLEENTIEQEKLSVNTLLPTPKNDEWVCDKCSTVNPNTYNFCQNCGNQRNKTNNT